MGHIKGYAPAFDEGATPSGRFPRWHCVATNYGQQFLAERTISADGWRVLFPLYLDRIGGNKPDRIGAMFPGYGFAEFDASRDDWPRICRARGVYRIMGCPGAPKPLPIGYVEDLMARMSDRRIVDDPGELPIARKLRRTTLRWSDMGGTPEERVAQLMSALSTSRSPVPA